MKLKASITIFISCLMIVILAFSSAICEAVRLRGARINASCVLDAAVESSMAKYDRVFMDEFGLFGSYYGEMESYKQSLIIDMEKILNPESEFFMLSDMDFWKISPESISLNEYQLITDNNGESFFEQAVLYTKTNAAAGIIDYLVDYANGNDSPEELDKYFAEEEQKTDELIETYTNEAQSGEINTDEEPYEYTGEIIEVEESPVDIVKEIKKTGIFALVIPQEGALSGSKIESDSLLSSRSLKTGIVGEPKDFDLIDKALFIEYISQKLANYTTAEQNDNFLNYKLEYCVGGKLSDEENLKYVINRLLLMREAVNFVYLLTDSDKVSQAMAVAAGLVGATGIQPLVEAVKYAILLAWAYAESIIDVRNLLNGGTSAIVKTSKNWKLSLENIGNLSEVLKDPVEEPYGFDYATYLKFMLMFKDGEEIVLGGMDMVEQVMREKYDNESYRLDSLIVSVEPVVTFHTEPVFMNFNFMNNYQYSRNFSKKTKYSYM